MGAYVGRRIAAILTNAAPPPAFAYRDQGELAAIGRGAAIVHIGRLKLTGTVGWLFWSLAHIFFLVTLRDRVTVSLNWAWTYVTHGRAARIVARPGDERAGSA